MKFIDITSYSEDSSWIICSVKWMHLFSLFEFQSVKWSITILGIATWVMLCRECLLIKCITELSFQSMLLTLPSYCQPIVFTTVLSCCVYLPTSTWIPWRLGNKSYSFLCLQLPGPSLVCYKYLFYVCIWIFKEQICGGTNMRDQNMLQEVE